MKGKKYENVENDGKGWKKEKEGNEETGCVLESHTKEITRVHAQKEKKRAKGGNRKRQLSGTTPNRCFCRGMALQMAVVQKRKGRSRRNRNEEEEERKRGGGAGRRKRKKVSSFTKEMQKRK